MSTKTGIVWKINLNFKIYFTHHKFVLISVKTSSRNRSTESISVATHCEASRVAMVTGYRGTRLACWMVEVGATARDRRVTDREFIKQPFAMIKSRKRLEAQARAKKEQEERQKKRDEELRWWMEPMAGLDPVLPGLTVIRWVSLIFFCSLLDCPEFLTGFNTEQTHFWCSGTLKGISLPYLNLPASPIAADEMTSSHHDFFKSSFRSSLAIE